MRQIAAIVFVLLVASVAVAQPSSSGLVRHYPLDYSGSINLCNTSIGCPTLGIYFQQTVAATLTPDIGASYVMTVAGNPTSVLGGTWAPGLTTQRKAWRFDGTGDYLSLADDPAFEVQDFSVFVCFIPRAGWATNDAIIAKSNSITSNRSWLVYTSNGTSVAFAVSDDGTNVAGHITTITKASAVAIGRLSCVTASYDYVSDGASLGAVRVDGLTAQTSTAMDGPPFPGTAAFEIAAVNGGLTDPPADFYIAAYYPGVLSAADHATLASWFRGLYDGTLSNAITVTSATPPAVQVAPADSGMQPFFIDQPANTTIISVVASGSGGLGWVEPVTNMCQRNTFETWAAGAPTGWTEGVTSTGDFAQVTTSSAHGSSAARGTLADADDAVTLTGACLTVTESTAYRARAWAKLISGTGLLDINILEDDSADCGSITTTTAVVNDAVPGAAWDHVDGTITTQAGTIRAQVQVSLPAAAAQVVDVDAVMLWVDASGVPLETFCGADRDASVVCTQILPLINNNPLGVSRFEVTGTFRVPYAAADISGSGWYWLYSKATSGTNNLPNIQVDASLNAVRGTVHGWAADYCYNYGDGVAEDADHTVKWTYYAQGADGDIRWTVDGTGYSNFACSGVGASRAIMDGIGTQLYIGGTYADAKGSGFVRNLKFYRRGSQ